MMQTIPIMLTVFAAMWIVEFFWPANKLPNVACWWPRVILTNLSQAGVVLLAGLTWDRWMAQLTWKPPWALCSHFNNWQQIIIAYVVLTFIYYWWHRLRHDSTFFWRICHQLHHSPRRLETLMSFYKHPVEITLNGLLSSAILYPLLGCSIKAAAIVTLVTGVAELFYHWNIKTPLWLGPFFQRPESHRIHHMSHHHTNNYSDIPLWDILFGTYLNPKEQVLTCGFDLEREARFDDMLGFRDVHAKGADRLAPMHLLPTCLGCSKRWACYQSRLNKHNQPSNIEGHANHKSQDK